MKLTKLKNNSLVPVNINKYLIDWNKAPSKGQLELQGFLVKYWKSDLVLAELRIPGSLLRVDILNATKNIIFEFDGSSSSGGSFHNQFTPFFHKNRTGYLNSIKRDYVKEDWAARNGYTLIRIESADLSNLSYDYFKEKHSILL